MPSWEEIARSIDSAVEPPEYRSLLRKQITTFCCEAALLFLEEDSQQDLSDETKANYFRRFLNLNDQWSRRLISAVSKCYATCRGIRVDLPLWYLFMDFARTRACELFRQLAVSRNSNCIEEFDDGNWSLVPNMLSNEDRGAMERVFREGRLSGELVSSCYADFMTTLVSLHAKQLLVIGVKMTESEASDPGFAMLNTLKSCGFDSDRFKAASKVVSVWADKFATEGKDAAKKYLQEMFDDEGNRFDIHGKMCGFLITNPASWEAMRPRLEEHFPGDWLPKNWEEPKNWRWAIEECDFVLATPILTNVQQPQWAAWHELRLLTALTMCFRMSDSETATSDGLHRVLEEGRPVRCRVCSIQLEDLQFISADAPIRSLMEPSSRSRISFLLSMPPVLNKDDFLSLAHEDLKSARRFLQSDTEDAKRLSRGLCSYESAIGLQSSGGIAPPEIEDAWSIVSLWTTIENIVGQSDKTLDLAIARLDSLIPKKSLYNQMVRALERTRKYRNDWVHGGLSLGGEDDVDSLFHATSILLRDEIVRCKRR